MEEVKKVIKIIYLEDLHDIAEEVSEKLPKRIKSEFGIECIVMPVITKEQFVIELNKNRFDLIVSDGLVEGWVTATALKMLSNLTAVIFQ